MERPLILILGKNGQVGCELQRTLAPIGSILALDFPEIDFAEPDGLRRVAVEKKPDVIVNAAAYTAVDKAESEPDRAMRINGIAPGILAETAKKTGALMIHYSTDYVYDGTKKAPYVETDSPHPLSAYGRTKLEGDQAVQSSEADHLIFRLCWVYGARGQNFMLTIQRLARERDKLRVVRDQIGCPTWSRMIAEATAQSLRRALDADDRTAFNGVYHLAAFGAASWHEFASRIVEWMPETERKCKIVEAISTSEYPTSAQRPANSVLNCDKLHKAFGLQLPHWEESLRLVLDKNL